MAEEVSALLVSIVIPLSVFKLIKTISYEYYCPLVSNKICYNLDLKVP